MNIKQQHKKATQLHKSVDTNQEYLTESGKAMKRLFPLTCSGSLRAKPGCCGCPAWQCI